MILGNMCKLHVKEETDVDPHCFLEQETLPLLLSTGWFQERIRVISQSN